jgi:cell division protein FtsA
MPGCRQLASQVMGLPARIAKPQNMVGLTDQLDSPAYATSVGLLEWALLMSEADQYIERRGPKTSTDWTEKLRDLLRRLLP